MLTVIFLDSERPDPTVLTFNAKSGAILQEEQQDKKGPAWNIKAKAPLVIQILQVLLKYRMAEGAVMTEPVEKPSLLHNSSGS